MKPSPNHPWKKWRIKPEKHKPLVENENVYVRFEKPVEDKLTYLSYFKTTIDEKVRRKISK